MLNRIKQWFAKAPKPTLADHLADIEARQSRTNEHLIALARLLFVKPEHLYRESRNHKANAEFLEKLIELMGKEDHEN